jgi:tRNA(fMet)-specific endonuclease VapC
VGLTRYLLDTNALSEPVRPRPHPTLLSFLAEHGSECAVSSVTWHEALFGVARLRHGARREALQQYLTEVVAGSFPILPYDASAAAWHASERARLASAGFTPSFADGQIAAIAQTSERVLVTANLADFEPFEGLDLYSWLA